jgi:hypothetical protein
MPGGIKEGAALSVNWFRDQRGRVTCVTLPPPSNDTVKVCDGLA